jgi:hypothetical protein
MENMQSVTTWGKKKAKKKKNSEAESFECMKINILHT